MFSRSCWIEKCGNFGNICTITNDILQNHTFLIRWVIRLKQSVMDWCEDCVGDTGTMCYCWELGGGGVANSCIIKGQNLSTQCENRKCCNHQSL